MHDIERQLNNLPKFKMRRRAVWKLSTRLYARMALAWIKRLPPLPAVRVYTWQTAVVTAMVLLVIVPMFAYASPSVLPGDFLYPVKRGVEQVELALAATPASQAKALVKLADRRLEEAQALVKQPVKPKSAEYLAETVTESIKLQAAAQIQAAKVTVPKVKQDLSVTLENKTAEYHEDLKNIAKKTGPAYDEKVVDALALALAETKNADHRQEAEESMGSAGQAAATTTGGEIRTIGQETSTATLPTIFPKLPIAAERDWRPSTTKPVEIATSTDNRARSRAREVKSKKGESTAVNAASTTESIVKQARQKIEEAKLKIQEKKTVDVKKKDRLRQYLDKKWQRVQDKAAQGDVQAGEKELKTIEAVTENTDTFLGNGQNNGTTDDDTDNGNKNNDHGKKDKNSNDRKSDNGKSNGWFNWGRGGNRNK